MKRNLPMCMYICIYKSLLFFCFSSCLEKSALVQVFREEMDLQPFLAKDHDLVVPKAPEIVVLCVQCVISKR